MMKICSKCSVKKELNSSNFAIKTTSKDGFDSLCKACKKKADHERYLKNKDEISKQKAEYYRSNKEKIKKSGLDYYHCNSKKCKESNKDWNKRNPIQRRILCERSRSNEYTSDNILTSDEWVVIKNYFHNSCAYCGMLEEEHLDTFGEKLHQEHLIPLIKGGSYKLGNIVPSCRNCNASKRNQDFNDWYPTSSGYSRYREKRILQYLDKLN